MYLRYGSYIHALGEAAVAITKETLRSQAGSAYAVKETWNVQGLLIEPSGSPSGMKTKIAALEAAYAADFRDVAILLPDGTTSAHSISSAATIGGVRVTQRPSFPDGRGAQHVTIRTFTIALEAIIPTSTENLVVEFQEAITLSGGGPRYGHIECLRDAPVKQELKRMTVYRATQTGRAVGLYRYPGVPGPIWPGALVENGSVVQGSPTRQGSTYIDWPVQWAYQFESAGPLGATRPNIWTSA
jgi:hypothetical protein